MREVRLKSSDERSKGARKGPLNPLLFQELDASRFRIHQ